MPFTAVSVKVCRGFSRVAKLTHDRSMQLYQQHPDEAADKNVYVTVGTAGDLHFPVVHVSFVLSAVLRCCRFICSRKEEPLRKQAFPCTLRQINAENHREVAAEGIMKTDDSHINVFPQFI